MAVGGMTALATALGAIAEDVRLIAPGRGRVSTGEEFAFGSPSSPVEGLTEILYGRHYCRPVGTADAGSDAAAFLQQLREANVVQPRWETWPIARADAAGLVLAGMNGAERRVAYSEAIAGPAGYAPGQTVQVPAQREASTPGHYAVFGRPIADASTGRQVRFYWNLAPAGGALFLRETIARLERRRIPFQAKVPLVPQGYARADGGVLYLNAEDVEAAGDLIAAIRRALTAFQRPETPLFTRALAPGLAFAESPPGAESFGMHRCRLLAEGLGEGFAAGRPPAEAMMARLIAYGIDPEAAERNPATAYPYRFETMAA